MSNLAAAKTNDRKKALIAARDTLAEAIDGAASRGDGTVAQLMAQYRATLAEIAELESGETVKVTVVDELAGRRQDRVAGSPDSVRPSRRRKSGDG